jgi:hypothetical protein
MRAMRQNGIPFFFKMENVTQVNSRSLIGYASKDQRTYQYVIVRERDLDMIHLLATVTVQPSSVVR